MKAPGQTASTANSSEWLPAPWILKLSAVVQWLLVWGGAAGLYGCGAFAAIAFWDMSWPVLLFGVVLMYLVITVHEFGHLLGALSGGMHVLRVHVGSVDALALRKGWKFRWAAPALKVDGAVFAVPRSDRSCSAQQRWFILGGPLANLLTALLAAPVAVLGLPSGWAWLLMGVAVFSAAIGLANLLPAQKVLANDGLQLLRLRRGIDEADPARLFSRINALCMEGATADELPRDLLDKLANVPDPPRMPLLWFDFFALVNRGEWAAAASMETRLDETLAGMPEQERRAWQPLTATMQTLGDISRCLHSGEVGSGLDRRLSVDCDWLQPSLRMLCRAIDAAAAGDPGLRDDWLGRAELAAEQSRDGATRRTQARLRAAIRNTNFRRLPAARLPAAEPA